MVTEQRFHELLRAYGQDLSRWPVAERDAAEKFKTLYLDNNPSLKKLWEEEQALDQRLHRFTAPSPSLALVADLEALAVPMRSAPTPQNNRSRPLLALVASVVLAFGIAGFTAFSLTPEPSSAVGFPTPVLATATELFWEELEANSEVNSGEALDGETVHSDLFAEFADTELADIPAVDTVSDAALAPSDTSVLTSLLVE